MESWKKFRKKYLKDFSTKEVMSFISFVILTTCLLLFCFVLYVNIQKDILKVSFLDIGQGDSIFIETPSGVQILIDGGINKQVLRKLTKEMSFWDRSIDIVLATHPDADHIGGLPEVVKRFEVDYYLKSDVLADSAVYNALEKNVKDENIETIFVKRGDVINFGDGVIMKILFPDRSLPNVEKNLASIITKITYGENSFLLTGDSPKVIEEYLISLDSNDLNVDILKLGHHGSKTSTSEAFLGYTSPEYAVISAGKDNSYGHPHKEVIDLLDNFEIEYLNTADVGSIHFESDGEQVWFIK